MIACPDFRVLLKLRQEEYKRYVEFGKQHPITVKTLAGSVHTLTDWAFCADLRKLLAAQHPELGNWKQFVLQDANNAGGGAIDPKKGSADRIRMLLSVGEENRHEKLENHAFKKMRCRSCRCFSLCICDCCATTSPKNYRDFRDRRHHSVYYGNVMNGCIRAISQDTELKTLRQDPEVMLAMQGLQDNPLNKFYMSNSKVAAYFARLKDLVEPEIGETFELILTFGVAATAPTSSSSSIASATSDNGAARYSTQHAALAATGCNGERAQELNDGHVHSDVSPAPEILVDPNERKCSLHKASGASLGVQLAPATADGKGMMVPALSETVVGKHGGVKQGDEIVSIHGTNVQNMPFEQAFALMFSKPAEADGGMTIELTLLAARAKNMSPGRVKIGENNLMRAYSYPYREEVAILIHLLQGVESPGAPKPPTSGWIRVESNSRPGRSDYVNRYTGERQVLFPFFPDAAASPNRHSLPRKCVESRSRPGEYVLENVQFNTAYSAAIKAGFGEAEAETSAYHLRYLGWKRVESRSRPGEYVYENVNTGERQAWEPTVDAPKTKGKLFLPTAQDNSTV